MTELAVQARRARLVEDRPAAVELDGLTRNYGERAALDGVTLTLGAGADAGGVRSQRRG